MRTDNGVLLSLAVWQLYVQQSSVMEPRGNADMVENMTSHNLLGAGLNTLNSPLPTDSSLCSVFAAHLAGGRAQAATTTWTMDKSCWIGILCCGGVRMDAA